MLFAGRAHETIFVTLLVRSPLFAGTLELCNETRSSALAPRRAVPGKGRGDGVPADKRALHLRKPEREEAETISVPRRLSPTKRKRLLKVYGSCPAGYTHQDVERLLDVLYGLFSYQYTPEDLRQIVVSDPFDHTDPPRCLRLLDLTDWLEALLD